MIARKPKFGVGVMVKSCVARSAVTGELYVPAILPYGKFDVGDCVAVGIIHWKDRPSASEIGPSAAGKRRGGAK